MFLVLLCHSPTPHDLRGCTGEPILSTTSISSWIDLIPNDTMGRLDRKYGNPYQKERKGIKCPRHFALQDLDRTDLDLLTGLLILPGYVQKPGTEARWLEEQEQAIRRLPYELVFPDSRREKLAIWLGSMGMFFCPGVAIVCSHHSGLDPRVIRNLFNLILVEADVRTLPLAESYVETRRKDENLLRRVDPGDRLVHWLDGVLKIAQMRIPSRPDLLYRDEDGGLSHKNRPFWTKCEACAMAKMAGDPKMLAYLLVCVRLRKGKHRKTRRPVRPRLLRIIKSWLKHHDEEARNAAEELCHDTVSRFQRFRELDKQRVLREKADHVEQRRRGKQHGYEGSGKRGATTPKQDGQNMVAASPADASRGRPHRAQQGRGTHGTAGISHGQTHYMRGAGGPVQLDDTSNTYLNNAASRIYIDGNQLLQDCDDELQPLCASNERDPSRDNDRSGELSEKSSAKYHPEHRWSKYTHRSARPAPLRLHKQRAYKELPSDNEDDQEESTEERSGPKRNRNNSAAAISDREPRDGVQADGEQERRAPPRPLEEAHWCDVSTQYVSVQQRDEAVRSEVGSIMAVSPMSSMSNLSFDQPCNAWSCRYSQLARGDHEQDSHILEEWI